MKRLVVRLVLSVLMSVLCFSVAQAAITYPLQLSAHILPPYGCRLSDYVVQGMERLNLTVLQRDLRYSNYDFLVRMQVKQGTKIVISSTAGYTVKSGQLTRLNSANLFNGLTADITAQDKYKENGFCLNEGAYEFVFQAFDAKNTALPVSEPVYFHTYLSKALPPACVFPANGSCVDYKSAAVSFAWMEKSVSMPSNGKRYSLEVYEMPEGFDGTDRAENLAGASEPVYRKDDINGNVTVHTAPISAGMFIKGRTYVWRVRSYSADFGQADSRVSGHVENNGYSQYSAFKFGTCVDVEDVWKKKDQAAIGAVKYDSSKKPVLESVDTSGAVAVVEWLHEPEKFCGYVVEWNMADTALAPWGQKIVSEKDSFAYISGLSYGVDYIVRLRGVICNGSEEQAYSACADNVLSFRLEKREDAECGNPVPQVTSLVSLKEAMKEGDVLSANGHDVTVLTCEMNVSGSDTTFTGTGLVSYGFLKSFFNLTVKFDNVKINDRKELLQGMVYANTDLNNCLDLNLNRLANKGSAGSGPAQRQTAKFDEFSSADNIPENKAGLAGGTMYAWDADGKRVECGTLEDTSCASNNLFVDSRHGEVLFDNLEGMEWNPPFDREKRPFDRNLTFSDYYENLDGYSVPWIGVPEGGATKVKATLLQGASVNPNDVHFVLRTGSQSIRLNAKRIDGNSSVATYEVPVFADKAGDKGAYLELSAVVSTGEGACSQQLVLGVAKVYAMKRETFNIRLVPCHDVTIDKGTIEQKLNKIYNPLGKTFTVTVDDVFYGDSSFSFIADTFNVTDISRWTTETEDMTYLKYLYSEERGFSEDSVYLFVLPKANIDGVTGFMPRGKHVGYLFCGENETIDERTVAHELGHGLFTLEHAFDYIDGSPVGSTNNLMDYSDGENLKVWQWTHMDNHGPVVPFFDGEEDAMDIFKNGIVEFKTKNYKGEFLFDNSFNLKNIGNKEFYLKNYKSFKYRDKDGDGDEHTYYAPVVGVQKGSSAKLFFKRGLFNPLHKKKSVGSLIFRVDSVDILTITKRSDTRDILDDVDIKSKNGQKISLKAVRNKRNKIIGVEIIANHYSSAPILINVFEKFDDKENQVGLLEFYCVENKKVKVHFVNCSEKNENEYKALINSLNTNSFYQMFVEIEVVMKEGIGLGLMKKDERNIININVSNFIKHEIEERKLFEFNELEKGYSISIENSLQEIKKQLDSDKTKRDFVEVLTNYKEAISKTVSNKHNLEEDLKLKECDNILRALRVMDIYNSDFTCDNSRYRYDLALGSALLSMYDAKLEEGEKYDDVLFLLGKRFKYNGRKTQENGFEKIIYDYNYGFHPVGEIGGMIYGDPSLKNIAHELGHGLMLSEANAQGCLSIGKKSPGADDNTGTGGNFMGYDDSRRHWYKHQFQIVREIEKDRVKEKIKDDIKIENAKKEKNGKKKEDNPGFYRYEEEEYRNYIYNYVEYVNVEIEKFIKNLLDKTKK